MSCLEWEANDEWNGGNGKNGCGNQGEACFRCLCPSASALYDYFRWDLHRTVKVELLFFAAAVELALDVEIAVSLVPSVTYELPQQRNLSNHPDHRQMPSPSRSHTNHPLARNPPPGMSALSLPASIKLPRQALYHISASER